MISIFHGLFYCWSVAVNKIIQSFLHLGVHAVPWDRTKHNKNKTISNSIPRCLNHHWKKNSWLHKAQVTDFAVNDLLSFLTQIFLHYRMPAYGKSMSWLLPVILNLSSLWVTLPIIFFKLDFSDPGLYHFYLKFDFYEPQVSVCLCCTNVFFSPNISV